MTACFLNHCKAKPSTEQCKSRLKKTGVGDLAVTWCLDFFITVLVVLLLAGGEVVSAVVVVGTGVVVVVNSWQELSLTII